MRSKPTLAKAYVSCHVPVEIPTFLDIPGRYLSRLGGSGGRDTGEFSGMQMVQSVPLVYMTSERGKLCCVAASNEVMFSNVWGRFKT